MFDSMKEYFAELASHVGQAWNRFWFTPSDVIIVCVLRVVVGAAATYYIASFSGDLTRWYGEHGFLPVQTVQTVAAGGETGGAVFRFSFLDIAQSSAALWALHILSLLAVIALTIGLFTRCAAVAALIATLSYINRAPLLAGPFESVLTMLLAYLCLAPAGVYLSLDRFWGRNKRARQGAKDQPGESQSLQDAPLQGLQSSPSTVFSWSANICVRLVQVHLAALCFMMALWKLGGQAWWEGNALWVLMAQTHSRLLDFSWLRSVPILVYFCTHFVIAFELAFGILIWNRWARPLLLALSIGVWGLLAIASGQMAFCLLMLAANVVFLSPAQIRRMLGFEKTQKTTTFQPKEKSDRQTQLA